MPTYDDLEGLLRKLGFADESVPHSHRAFRHHASGTLFLFPMYDEGSPVSPRDWASVRRHLIECGLLGEAELDRFARPGDVPASRPR